MKLRIAGLMAFALLAASCSGNVFDLAVGDCFDDPDNFEEISSVPMVECSAPHHNEVYFTYNLPDSPFPGLQAVEEAADTDCYERFEGFVGMDYASSELDYGYLYPTGDTWSEGDREVVCLVYHVTGDKVTGSQRNARI
jgi:hypothetical protein